ncbi:MAG: tRNA dihydrouridine synthase DusB [Gammaproteobacteria bacterium]|nr:MAG: tRNA dihydrouridine synthase DusB [Gammaproteobacteria bacterium]
MFCIGPYRIENPVILAPMAGVTDLPFRKLCRSLGAGFSVGEMLSANPALKDSTKSRLRRDHRGEPGPISVQILGHDPDTMAEAARFNVAAGAQIIDINMGCPAKKVCRKAAGSALLADPAHVDRILRSVVNAVDVPVTLKIRTGPSPEQRNGVLIAQLAEAAGVQALTVHGRTRTCRFEGAVEYDTIAAIKQAVSIPVIANGDIDSPQKALAVLTHTGADGVMIGRAAQGNPWVFREIRHTLDTGERLAPPSREEVFAVMQAHWQSLIDFYGDFMGLRIARKHIGWYLDRLGLEAHGFNCLTTASGQAAFLDTLAAAPQCKDIAA